MPFGRLAGSNNWLLYGRRMVLKPRATTWSSMSVSDRVHSPWGAKLLVSRPNQLTPVMRTSCSLASNSFAPTAWNGAVGGRSDGESDNVRANEGAGEAAVCSTDAGPVHAASVSVSAAKPRFRNARLDKPMAYRF